MNESFLEHIEHIRKVLQILKSRELKLKAAECKQFKREVSFLGGLVSEDGYHFIQRFSFPEKLQHDIGGGDL